jgi:hypothetical protein
MACAPAVCPLCGARWDEGAGRVCRSACPLASGCRLLRCPHCGYEVPAPGPVTRGLARWLGRAEESS